MNKTDNRSSIPRLDPNVKHFFEEYIEKCKAEIQQDVNPFSEKIFSYPNAQNEEDVNSFFNMFSELLLKEMNTTSCPMKFVKHTFNCLSTPAVRFFCPKSKSRLCSMSA